MAQVYTAIRDRFDVKCVESILQKEGCIDQEIPKDCYLQQTDYNLLHYAFSANSHRIFELLIKYKADYTLKNDEGRTVVHRAISEKSCEQRMPRSQFDNKFISSVLSAHVKDNNAKNPSSDYGITHFHVACMVNHVPSVTFFLNNGVSVHETVDADSPLLPHWTSLHFAAGYLCLQTAEILLKNGANIHAKDAQGVTPLAILLKHKIKGVDWKMQDVNEKMMEMFVKHDCNVNTNIVCDGFGLSSIHVASLLKDTSAIESIFGSKSSQINQPISKNSLICPGYTPLHFAATFNVNTVKLLLSKGADIEAKDSNNLTPFDMCLQKYSIEDVHYIISRHIQWKDIILSDNKTRLVDLISAMINVDQFDELLENIESITDLTVPQDSPLWPGCTILHLSIIFFKATNTYDTYCHNKEDDSIKKVEKCLTRGALVTTPDANGKTAVHTAFYMQKSPVLKLLLGKHQTTENPLDSNNLSYFHIACVTRDESAVRKFISSGVDVNVPVNTTIKWHAMCHHNLDYKPRYFFISPGSTALHINVASGNGKITRILLDNGADVYAKDANDFTPIHRLFTSRAPLFDDRIDDLLLKLDGLQDCVAAGGLTHLHVACHYDNLEAIKKLLDRGANINARVHYKFDGIVETVKEAYQIDLFCDPYGDPTKKALSILSSLTNFTPLHFSMHNYNYRSKKFLIERGADIFAKNSHGYIKEPVYECLNNFWMYSSVFIPKLMQDITFQDRLHRQFGIKLLHAVCYAGEDQLARLLLMFSTDDINARVNMDSDIWPGCTPLHLVTKKLASDINEDNPHLRNLVQLLLECGADITLKDQTDNTPLHNLDGRYDRPFADSFHTGVLLRAINDFTVNPVNSQGISFFHIACIKKDVSIVKRYLEHGVDVNKAVGQFSDRYSGSTPLHLAAGYLSDTLDDPVSQLETINVLLEYGADVRARDVCDNTPLHEVARKGPLRAVLFEILILNGADLKAENLQGETALEILMKSGNAEWDEIICLLNYGCFINSHNPITQIGIITHLFPDETTKNKKALENGIIKKLLGSEHIDQKDEMGRTFLHNIVAVRGVFIKDYTELIEKLLECNLDIDFQDNTGRTALHIAAQFGNNRGIFGLLKNGADLNIIENQGRTPFHYAFYPTMIHDDEWLKKYDPYHPIDVFATHVKKMLTCKLYVNELNLVLQERSEGMHRIKSGIIYRFEESIEKTKNLKIGSTCWTLFNFCFEIDAEMMYPHMTLPDRLDIDHFFENIGKYNLRELDYMLKLKHSNCLERRWLIDVAGNSLNNLAKIQVPELCSRFIFRFLTRHDLKNLVAAEKIAREN